MESVDGYSLIPRRSTQRTIRLGTVGNNLVSLALRQVLFRGVPDCKNCWDAVLGHTRHAVHMTRNVAIDAFE